MRFGEGNLRGRVEELERENARLTAEHLRQLKSLGKDGYPCAALAAREVEQLNEYAYALECALVYGFSNRDEMRGMIGGLRESIAPDVEFHEVPRLEEE